MAKKPTTNTNDQKIEFPEVDMNSVLASGITFTMGEAMRLVGSQFVEVPNLRSIRENGYHRDGMLMLVGKPGIGKTTKLEYLARSNDIDFSYIDFAGTELADNLGMSMPIEDPNRPGQYVRLSFGKPYRKPESGRVQGLTLINEALGGNADQQKQFRSLLSKREITEMKLHPGHVLVGDSNPATAKFFTNRNLDYSLQSRIFFIPVTNDPDENLRFMAANDVQDNIVIPVTGNPVKLTRTHSDSAGGAFHEMLYLFLRKFGTGSHGFLNAVDPRRWTMISCALSRMESSGLVDQALMQKFLSIALPESIVTAYNSFAARGDDPRYYPVRGDHFFEADKAGHAAHMKLVNHWIESSELNIMLGYTVTEIIDYMRTLQKFTPTQISYLRDLATTIDPTQFLLIIRGASYHGTIINQIFEATKGTRAEAELEELNGRR